MSTNSAIVPGALKPTDSAQNPYSLTPLATPKPPAIQSPTYGTGAYNTALTNSGMVLNDKTQQTAMAAANPTMANPVAGPSFTGLPKAPASATPKPTTPASPTSAAAVTPQAPVPTPQSPLKTTPVQERQYPEGWIENKQLGYAVPSGPPGSAGWPTREETGYTDASGKRIPGTDLRYTGYYTDGSNNYRYEDIDPMTAQYYRWVAPWKNPYEQEPEYYYGMPGQPG